jgi:hypothetical protein
MRIGSINIGSGNIGTGLIVGAGAAILAPIAMPLVGGLLKTVTKGVIKTGLLAYEGGKGVVTTTATAFQDLTAEAKAELSQGGAPAAAAPKAKPATPDKKTKPKTAKKKTG